MCQQRRMFTGRWTSRWLSVVFETSPKTFPLVSKQLASRSTSKNWRPRDAVRSTALSTVCSTNQWRHKVMIGVVSPTVTWVKPSAGDDSATTSRWLGIAAEGSDVYRVVDGGRWPTCSRSSGQDMTSAASGRYPAPCRPRYAHTCSPLFVAVSNVIAVSSLIATRITHPLICWLAPSFSSAHIGAALSSGADKRRKEKAAPASPMQKSGRFDQSLDPVQSRKSIRSAACPSARPEWPTSSRRKIASRAER